MVPPDYLMLCLNSAGWMSKSIAPKQPPPMSVGIFRLILKAPITTAADNILDPVVQNIISLTSSLVIKMLTILVSKTSNLQVFLLKKKCKSYSHLQMQKLLTFFSAKILAYIPYLMILTKVNDQSFNDTLTNDVVNFEQPGSDLFFFFFFFFFRENKVWDSMWIICLTDSSQETSSPIFGKLNIKYLRM